MKLTFGGAEFTLDPSAISAVRYRAAYGDSIVNHLAASKTDKELEGHLLRMCHQMIVPAQRPDLLAFAALVRKDTNFLQTATLAKQALLSQDKKRPRAKKEEASADFDEYNILALMTAARVDMQLLYELPLLHITSVINRSSEMRDPNHKTIRKMTDQEMRTLYGR